MLRKVTKGEGLLTYETYEIEWKSLTYEERETLLQDARMLTGPESRERTAIELRQVLKRADIKSPDTEWSSEDELLGWIQCGKSLSLDSLEYLALHWLLNFSRLRSHQERLAAEGYDEELALDLIHCAEELGRLQERIWWRQTPVPKTETKRSPRGKSPEQLALARLRSDRPLQQSNKGRVRLNAERKAAAESWQVKAQGLADAYWVKHPKASKARVALHVHSTLEKQQVKEKIAAQKAGEEWEERHLPLADTIRRGLTKPVST